MKIGWFAAWIISGVVIFMTGWFLGRRRALARASREPLGQARPEALTASKMALLGEISSGIAHEIDNPLTVIYAQADQLLGRIQSGRFDESRIKSGLQTIVKTSEMISKIVRGMRAFARNGESDPFVRVSLEEIVHEALVLCRSRFVHRQIRLELDAFPEDSWLECRPTQISQVLLNLLQNAHDAIEERSEKWIRISVRESGESLELSVTDSGQGIPAAVRGKMMRPFFTTKGPGQGTGLGLSISSNIIERHHGELRVDENCPNTRLIVRLPRTQKIPSSQVLDAPDATDAMGA